MASVFVQERQSFHHPGVQTRGRMSRHLTNDVKPVLQPGQFRTRRGWEDCNLAIFALVTVLRYGPAAAVEEDDTSESVV
jgi:hypothetical protein